MSRVECPWFGFPIGEKAEDWMEESGSCMWTFRPCPKKSGGSCDVVRGTIPLKEESVLLFNPFEGDWGGDFTVLSDGFLVGRKEHECSNCFGKIERGERHRVQVSTFDGEVKRHRWCRECCLAMQRDVDEGEWEPYENRCRMFVKE